MLVILAGGLTACGSGVDAAAPRGGSVTAASVALSAHTHHGADALSALRVSGRCLTGRVWVIVGHEPPYEPLRRTGSPAIDRTRPPTHARLATPCHGGRFTVRRKQLAVRWGDSPLRARTSTEHGDGVEVTTHTYAIE